MRGSHGVVCLERWWSGAGKGWRRAVDSPRLPLGAVVQGLFGGLTSGHKGVTVVNTCDVLLAAGRLQIVVALGVGWVYGMSASGWDDGEGDDCCRWEATPPQRLQTAPLLCADLASFTVIHTYMNDQAGDFRIGGEGLQSLGDLESCQPWYAFCCCCCC